MPMTCCFDSVSSVFYCWFVMFHRVSGTVAFKLLYSLASRVEPLCSV